MPDRSFGGRRSKVRRYENVVFFRVTESGVEKIPSSSTPQRVKHIVLMAPLKSVAVSPFSFPFNNVLRIREALKLQTLPYAAAGGMDLFPSIIGKTPRSSGGVVWFVPSNELEALSSLSGHLETGRAEIRVWPAPLPLVSKIHGEGAVFWLDKDNVSSMLWRGGLPVLYRWKALARTTLGAELEWFRSYCKSRDEELGEFFVLNAEEPSELAALPEIVQESLALCPWLGEVNLSQRALDSAVVVERTVHFLSRAALWILIMGILVLGGNGLRYYEARRSIGELRERSSELYRSVFEPARTGRIADPLGLARSKIEELKGGAPEGYSLNEVFIDLGSIFEQNLSMDVTLDAIRYNVDGVVYTGSAPDREKIQEFWSAWAERVGNVPYPSINPAPGVGYRFEMNVRW
jgi:hypothetical protein